MLRIGEGSIMGLKVDITPFFLNDQNTTNQLFILQTNYYA